jgi:deoxyguanosine kinase
VSDSLGTVVVAGNIATGKTHLITELAAATGTRAFPERWMDNPWFGSPNDSYLAQLWFLVASAADQTRASAGEGGIVERSIHEHALVFAAAQLHGREAGALQYQYERFDARLPSPDLVVYLRAHPATLADRVIARGRPQERGTTLDYLELLDAGYARLFDGWDRCPVLEVDTETADLRTPEGSHGVIAKVLSCLGGEAS